MLFSDTGSDPGGVHRLGRARLRRDRSTNRGPGLGRGGARRRRGGDGVSSAPRPPREPDHPRSALPGQWHARPWRGSGADGTRSWSAFCLATSFSVLSIPGDDGHLPPRGLGPLRIAGCPRPAADYPCAKSGRGRRRDHLARHAARVIAPSVERGPVPCVPPVSQTWCSEVPVRPDLARGLSEVVPEIGHDGRPQNQLPL